jgi:hypothetical protein
MKLSAEKWPLLLLLLLLMLQRLAVSDELTKVLSSHNILCCVNCQQA